MSNKEKIVIQWRVVNVERTEQQKKIQSHQLNKAKTLLHMFLTGETGPSLKAAVQDYRTAVMISSAFRDIVEDECASLHHIHKEE